MAVVGARQSIEQGEIAKPQAGLDVSQRDLLACDRDRADAYGAVRSVPSGCRRTVDRARIASRSDWESFENQGPVSMF
jgi:hypothetical protein